MENTVTSRASQEYLGMKTPQSRKERKYTWQYCLIVSLNCRCWRFVWKDLNIFFGYIERTVQMHSDMVNKCTWVVVEPLWKWLVILLQFPSGPVLLHGTVSIPERLVSHWSARKSYLMTCSVFRCHTGIDCLVKLIFGISPNPSLG